MLIPVANPLFPSAMKTQIHPQYHTDAVVTCLCGNTFTTGSTLAELKTEVCSVCHPFFTGTQRIIDTGGQVERFRRRAAAKTGKQPVEAVADPV
jgi:large subunit ribosomal protein L31